jgi:hypothetical protein
MLNTRTGEKAERPVTYLFTLNSGNTVEGLLVMTQFPGWHSQIACCYLMKMFQLHINYYLEIRC